jgi:ABC-type uncharacterized transport system involved in gliding motility auxiliary subunit
VPEVKPEANSEANPELNPEAGLEAGPERRRRPALPAGVGRAGMLGAGVLLVAVLVAMVNYFGWKYHARLDWTASQLYTLSSKTENVLADLDRDVEVVVFLMPGDELYEPTRELLARYEAASQHVSVRFMDAARDPLEAQQLAERYGVETASVVFVSGDDRQVVQREELAQMDFSGFQFGQQEPEVKAFKGERMFTSAIVDLSTAVRPRVAFTTGHGERRLDDLSGAGLGELERLLRDDNFEIEEWASLGAAAVPAGTDLVVIAGPKSSFVAPELELLDGFLRSGGRLLALVDPVLAPGGEPRLVSTGLDQWLAGWGVELGDDVVIDPGNPLPFYGPETIFATDFGDHPTTRSLRQEELAVLVSLTRSARAGEAVSGMKATELLRSSDQGWAETDLAEPGRDETDRPGPVPLGVAVETEAPADEAAAETAGDELTGEADDEAAADAGGETAAPASPAVTRLAVFGDSDFAADQLLRANVANAVLLGDTVNWLVEREALLGIPAREPERVRLSLPADAARWIYLLVLLVLPGLAIAAGVAVAWRRRTAR